MEIYIKIIVTILTVVFSAQNSKQFFELLHKFDRFDKFTLRLKCPLNFKAQIFYLLYLLFVSAYYFVIIMIVSKSAFYVIFMWTLGCMSTMIIITQYAIYVRMLRDRFKLANKIFANSKYPTNYLYICLNMII